MSFNTTNQSIQNSANKFIKNYNNTKVKECKKMIDFCENEIIMLKKKINELDIIKKNCKSEVIRLCEHKWVIDRSFQDEHTTYMCCKCSSYND
tara:strand:+ start:625 stop:903 length:279 start_codon:yes stop_codon:yes gene_type:complete